MTPTVTPSDGLGRFFALSFLYSWILWIAAALTGQDSTQFPTIMLFGLGGFGPSLAGIYLTHRLAPPGQQREFWRSAVDFKRVSLAWYALIFLAFPILTGLAVWLSVRLGAPPPGLTYWTIIAAQPTALAGLVIMGLLTGPLAEEFGWRGFALDRMVRRWQLGPAVLLLGLIWWAWHLPLFFIRGATHHTWGLFTPFFWLFLAIVIPLSIFMALAYLRNRRSILTAILAHFMFNFTLGLFFPISELAMLLQVVLFYLLAIVLFQIDRARTAAARP